MQRIVTNFLCCAATRNKTSSCRLCHNHNKRNLYEVLNLKKDASEKEVRESFLKLSKQNHPDTKQSGNGTRAENEKFIDILHAYRVLSKKDSRARYDVDLETFHRHSDVSSSTSTTRQSHYMRYGDMAPSGDPNPGPYYGVKGVEKVSNFRIAVVLIMIAVVGTITQFFLIRHSVTLRRDTLDDISKEAGAKHATVRAEAEKYGNKKQLERLAEKWIQRNNR